MAKVVPLIRRLMVTDFEGFREVVPDRFPGGREVLEAAPDDLDVLVRQRALEYPAATSGVGLRLAKIDESALTPRSMRCQHRRLPDAQAHLAR